MEGFLTKTQFSFLKITSVAMGENSLKVDRERLGKPGSQKVHLMGVGNLQSWVRVAVEESEMYKVKGFDDVWGGSM